MIGFLHIFFRLLIALLIGAAAYKYFGLVLPPAATAAVAITLAVLELLSPLFLGARRGSTGGAGASLRLLGLFLKSAAPALLWPAAAWGVLQVAPDQREAAIAAGAGFASLSALFAAGHGQGREGARLLAVLVALAVVSYGMLQTIPAGHLAGAAAAMSAALGLVVVRSGIVLPKAQTRALDFSILAAFAATAISMILSLA